MVLTIYETLEDMRQRMDALQEEQQRLLRVRVQWELRHATNPELRDVLQQAYDGRISLQELMMSEPYLSAHGAKFAAMADTLRDQSYEGQLPTDAEMEEGWRQASVHFERMAAEVAAEEQAEAEELQARIDRGEPVWDPKTRTWLN